MAEFLFITKILFTAYVMVLIPVYWKNYGWRNFLWFSDVGVFLTLAALWLNSSLLNSMALIGILPFELIWVVDFAAVLATKRKLLGITDYMFDTRYTKFLRALSLFHIILPIIWITCLIEWGYDADALFYQVLLTECILLTTYFLTDPALNINWVYLPKERGWHSISSLGWLFILLIGFPILVIYPLHLFFGLFK